MGTNTALRRQTPSQMPLVTVPIVSGFISRRSGQKKVKGSAVDFCSLALIFFEKTIWAG